MKDILDSLNEEQKKAVQHIDGPVMVIAGAGSGKTRVLTYRVAYLIENGIDPFNILTLTFTNKAAREMKDRISKLIGPEARNIWMGTFHSVFARILRQEAHLLNYPSNFTIYDTDDAKRLIKKILKAQNLDPKIYAPNYVLQRISGAKSNLIGPVTYNRSTELKEQDAATGKARVGDLYTLYNKELKKADAMDFDDLLYNTNVLFRDFPDTLYKYQNKFKHILVDEYQESDDSQYLIVKKLAANNENLCVVGDDAQSIYAFRGANIQNILNFKKDYPNNKIFKLEQNYRSTKNIVKAANSIIKYNKEQIEKDVWTSNDEGDLVQIHKTKNENEEGKLIANLIFQEKLNQQIPNSSFAILYRTNAQSRSIEDALRKQNIPYKIFGGLSFYKRKEIKDLLSYFRLVCNTKDEDALLRIINYPARGIGNTSLDKIIIHANQNNISLWEMMTPEKLQSAGITAAARKKVLDFSNMIKRFNAQLHSFPAYNLAKEIASASCLTKLFFEDKTPEGVSRYENIEELLNAIKEFTDTTKPGNSIATLDKFMEDIALFTDADENDKQDGDWVSLMTIHASKGLEFPYVYISGMEENLFPSIMSINTRTELEEERRLFYVAITRAEKKVNISFAENRYKWGQLTICEPSRFIEEIDPRLTTQNVIKREVPNLQGTRFSGFKNQQKQKLRKLSDVQKSEATNTKTDTTLSSSEIIPGLEVSHQKFGKGKVISVDGSAQNKKASIQFYSVGQKQLLLKFAKLSKA
ncbi:MAG: ATP-dependent helicase [Bacteroidales bacterium]